MPKVCDSVLRHATSRCADAQRAGTTETREARHTKRQWIETAKALEQRSATMSRGLPSAGAQPRPAYPDAALADALAPVIDEAEELARERQADATRLRVARGAARKSSDAFIRLLTQVGWAVGPDAADGAPAATPGPDASAPAEYVDKLKVVVETAAAQLGSLRKEHEFEVSALAERESTLTRELADAARAFEAWEHEPARTDTRSAGDRRADAPRAPRTVDESGRAAAESAPGCAPAAEGEGSLHAQVEAIDERLARLGGRSCGWGDEEHSAFLRSRPRGPAGGVGDGAAWIEHAALALGMSARSVEAHASRTDEREALLARRKELVATWKRRREVEAAARRREEAEAADEPRAARPASARLASRREAAEEQRMRRLTAWRQERLDKLAAEERAHEAAEAAARVRAAAEAQRHAKAKAALAERALKREAEARAIAAIEEESREHAAARATRSRALELLSLQQRDEVLADRRRRAIADARDERARQQRNAEEIPRAPTVEVERDASRVLQPTRAAEVRRRETQEEKPPQRAGARPDARSDPGRRAVPSWRQGLR